MNSRCHQRFLSVLTSRLWLPVNCSGATCLAGVLARWSPFPPPLIAGFSSARCRAARNGPGEKASASASECFCGTFSGLGLYPWPCAPRGAGHTAKAMRGEEEEIQQRRRRFRLGRADDGRWFRLGRQMPDILSVTPGLGVAGTPSGRGRWHCWVITQRSQVRILSPLPAEMAPGDFSGGHFHATCE